MPTNNSINSLGPGDVQGPALSTNEALVVYDGTTGRLVKNGVVTQDSTGNISQSTAVSGASLSILTSNTSNTANATAFYAVRVAGSTASDAYYQANITSGQSWVWGLDNSDSDAYVLSSSSTPGTTNVMRVATTGEINFPLQSAFLAINTIQRVNETGNGTIYTLIFDSEIFDQNNDFDGVSTYTAPLTGRYHFSTSVLLTGILSTHTVGDFDLVTSNRTLRFSCPAPSKVFDANTNVSYENVMLMDMDAGDTCQVKIAIFNGTKVVDIQPTHTCFSGYLEC